jgi:hypothetical protein
VSTTSRTPQPSSLGREHAAWLRAQGHPEISAELHDGWVDLQEVDELLPGLSRSTSGTGTQREQKRLLGDAYFELVELERRWDAASLRRCVKLLEKLAGDKRLHFDYQMRCAGMAYRYADEADELSDLQSFQPGDAARPSPLATGDLG